MTFPVKPTFPTWATNPGTRVEPSSGEKATGWVYQQKPPYNTFNWLDGAQGDALEWLDKAKVLAPERTVFVDPDNGNDSTGNGSGRPFATIGAALDFIVTLRGGGTAGQDGTAGEWWSVSVAPGVYAEDIEVPGWVMVSSQVPLAARLAGVAPNSGAVVKLTGGGTGAAPCGVSGLTIGRTAAENGAVTLNNKWAVEVTANAGNGAGDLSVVDAALILNCDIQTAPVELIAAPDLYLHGLHVTGGVASFFGCNFEIPPEAVLSTSRILVEAGGALCINGGSSAWPEAGPIRLQNAAWLRDQAVFPTAPLALAISNVYGGGFGVRARLTQTWATTRGLGSAPYGLTIFVNDAQISSIDCEQTITGATAPDVTFEFRAITPSRLESGGITAPDAMIVANRCTVNLAGSFGGSTSVGAMLDPLNFPGGPPFANPGYLNLTNGAEVSVTQDRLAATTAASPRTALVTVAAGLTEPAQAVFGAGADYRCTGAVDAVTIQRALDYVALSPAGGVVQLGPGVFNLGGVASAVPILSIPANVTLRGMGVGTALVCGDNAHNGTAGIELAGASARLESVTVSGDAVNAVVLVSGFGASVRDVQIDASDLYSVSTGAGLTVTAVSTAVDQVSVTGSPLYGIWIIANNCNAGLMRSTSAVAVASDFCIVSQIIGDLELLGGGFTPAYNQIGAVQGDVSINGGGGNSLATVFGDLDVTGGANHSVGQVTGDVNIQTDGNSVGAVLGNLTISGDGNTVGCVRGGGGSPPLSISGDRNAVTGGSVTANGNATMVLVSGNSNTVSSLFIGLVGNTGTGVEVTGDDNAIIGCEIDFNGSTGTGIDANGGLRNRVIGNAMTNAAVGLGYVNGGMGSGILSGNDFGGSTVTPGTGDATGWTIPAGALASGVPTSDYIVEYNKP